MSCFTISGPSPSPDPTPRGAGFTKRLDLDSLANHCRVLRRRPYSRTGTAHNAAQFHRGDLRCGAHRAHARGGGIGADRSADPHPHRRHARDQPADDAGHDHRTGGPRAIRCARGVAPRRGAHAVARSRAGGRRAGAERGARRPRPTGGGIRRAGAPASVEHVSCTGRERRSGSAGGRGCSAVGRGGAARGRRGSAGRRSRNSGGRGRTGGTRHGWCGSADRGPDTADCSGCGACA